MDFVWFLFRYFTCNGVIYSMYICMCTHTHTFSKASKLLFIMCFFPFLFTFSLGAHSSCEVCTQKRLGCHVSMSFNVLHWRFSCGLKSIRFSFS